MISSLLTAALLVGCAAPHAIKPASLQVSATVQKQMQELQRAAGVSAMYFLEVSSPDDMIAAKVMQGMLASGRSSTAVDGLVDLFKLSQKIPSGIAIGVVGQNLAINAGTLKNALEKFKNQRVAGAVYLLADQENARALKEQADLLGLRLIALVHTTGG